MSDETRTVTRELLDDLIAEHVSVGHDGWTDTDAIWAALPTSTEGLDPTLALVDKAKVWRDAGIITEHEYGVVCGLVFVRLGVDLSDDERAQAVEIGRRFLIEHPEVAARLASLSPSPTEENPK